MPTGSFARALRHGRPPAVLIITALVASAITLVAAPAAMAAAPSVSASISGGNILAGETGTFTVSATNPAGVDGYNLALFVDVPDGVGFISSTLGTPVIYNGANPPTVALPAGMQRWVWEDLSDLPAGGTRTGTITVLPAQPPAVVGGVTSALTVSPVGATVTATAYAALSGNPTYLPVFNGSTGVGGAAAMTETGTSAAATATVTVVSLIVTMKEPSPEAELERGVHHHTTVTTLTARASTAGDTQGAVLVTYIPAGLEFLGCGATDNSTFDRGAGDAAFNEYDGAASLTATPVVAANCPVPASVETVKLNATDAAAAGITAGAVYTKVTWNLGTVAAGSTVTVNYATAVPLQQNTVTWDGATPSPAAPSPASGGQSSNLDNNNGDSTRQGSPSDPGADGTAWTSVANVAGDYAGVVRTGAARGVANSASTTIDAMDLSVLKSVDSTGSQFKVGRIATFTLKVLASEYMSSTGIVLTDTIPNGVCPLLPAGVSFTIDTGATVSDECKEGGTVSGADLVSATAHVDGTFTVVLRPNAGSGADAFTLAANGTQTITYQALNRTAYITDTATKTYGNTTSGDSFSNHVAVGGTTTAIPSLAAAYPLPLQAWDDSRASIKSDLTTIDKQVMPRTGVAQGLAAGVDPCTAGTFQQDTAQGFRMGDTVCFELRVAFPSSIATRNPAVQDFLPSGLTYQGSAVTSASTAAVTSSAVTSATTSTRIDWKLGTVGAGGALYVQPGAVFVAHVWATVNKPSNGTALDKPENLMKYRQQNVKGELYFLRDQAKIEVDPELQLVKGVKSVKDNSAVTSSTREAATWAANDGATFASNRDGILVSEGETVTYRIDLLGLPYDATASEVWDLLPTGIKKINVSNISPGGVVIDLGTTGYPTAKLAAANRTRSVIMWTNVPVPGGKATLTYDVKIPFPFGVSKKLTNTASIISYSAGVNTSANPAAQQYIPADSLDTSRSATANTTGTGTTDSSEVHLANAVVAKSITSGTATNNPADQVVKGETATSTYSVTVPAHTTVYKGVLTDVITTATNWATIPGATTVTYPGGGSTLPGATSFSIGSNAFTVNTTTGALTFPTTYYSNTTDADQTFTVTLQAYIKSTATTWLHSKTTDRPDTASFASTGNIAITARAAVRLIEPSPTLTKAASATTVTASQAITYTLTAGNVAGRPTLYGTVVTDCVPAELETVTPATPTAGTVTTSTSAVGCAGTLVTWTVGDIDGGVTRTLQYTATVSASSAGSATYINNAALTGYSLAAGAPDRATYKKAATATVKVGGATIAKTINATTATIGQQRTFTITTTIPAKINFYDTVLVDDVPAGMTISSAAIHCTKTVLGDCDADLTGSATVLTASGTTRAWWLGDIASSPVIRKITATYTGTVLNVPGNVKAGALVNSARVRWNLVNTLTSAPSTYASYAGTTTSATVTAKVTITEPTVAMAKTVQGAASASVNPGASFTYSVKATNTGTSTAYGVTITDAVPVGVIITGTIPSGGVLSGASANGSGTITWTVASLTVATPVTLTYTAKFANSTTLSGTALTNTASVPQYFSHPTGTGYDTAERRTYSGPSATANVTPLFPKLQVTKAATGTVAYIGAPHTFTVTIKNIGAGPATGVKAVDTLPAGFEYVAGSAVITPGTSVDPTIVGQQLTWSTLSDMPASATTTITYTAVAKATYAWGAGNTGSGVLHTNTAKVTALDASGAASHFDSVFYTDTANASVTINDANLSMAKSHTGAIVAGSDTTWTLTVANAGPDDAVGPIVITDQLPVGATFTSISGAGWNIGTLNASNVLTLTRNTTLTSGASTSVQVTVSFASSAAAGSSATNSACVAAKTFDHDTSDNCASDRGTVVVEADLALVKIATATSYTAGRGIDWLITVNNNGPSDSQAPISVTDTLPASVDWTTASASGSGWTCGSVSTVTGKVTCTLDSGSLVTGASLPDIAVTATVKSSWRGTIVNTATVTGTTPEPATPGTTNNTETVTTGSVLSSADLQLTTTLASTDLVAGGSGRYRVAVTNHGPSDALTVVVADKLPSGLTFAGNVTSPGGAWMCTVSATVTGEVDCTLDVNLGTLANGASTWFEFDVDVASSVTGRITNTATVSSDTPDPDPDNNTDAVGYVPLVDTNVSITKKHPTAPVYRAGDEVTFTITVTNDGKADAADVSVVDAMPAGLTFARVENGTGWTVTGPDTSGHVTLSLDAPLPAGASPVSRSIDVVGVLDSGALPTVVNGATVTTTTKETTTDDNAASDTVLVRTPDLEIVKDASGGIVEGGDTFAYTLTVSNVDASAHADSVKVTDPIPSDLKLVTDPADIGTPLWTCSLTGADSAGFGGTLSCTLASLTKDTTATTLTYDVLVAADVARDTVVNTATVSSPDENASRVDARNTDDATVNVSWIHLTSTPSCVKDGPWLQYTIAPRNVATGLPITLTWYPDADANGVADGPAIATQTLPGTTGSSPISGETLWPGTIVDSNSVVIGLPGYRVVTAGETPTWQNLIADPSLPEYALLSGALVTVTAGPSASASVAFPATDSVCAATRDAVLNIDKSVSSISYSRDESIVYKLSVTNVGYGATNDVVVTDPIPGGLRVLSVEPAGPKDPAVAAWRDCAMTGTAPDGSGGLLTCVLDGWIGHGQTAPTIVIRTLFATDASLGEVTNVATVTWTDPYTVDSPKFSASDKVTSIVAFSGPELLAFTGINSFAGVWSALGLVLLGGGLILVRRRRPGDAG